MTACRMRFACHRCVGNFSALSCLCICIFVYLFVKTVGSYCVKKAFEYLSNPLEKNTDVCAADV